MKWLALLALSGCQLIFELPDQATVLDCPANYDPLDLGDGKMGFYRFVSEPETVRLPPLLAEADCKKDGKHTHLAVIGSKTSPTAEANVLFAKLRDLSSADVIFGLSRRTGDYRWITDEPVPIPTAMQPPWGTDEPIDPDNQPCVEIDIDTGAFVAIPCNVFDAYVCECDLFPEQPASF